MNLEQLGWRSENIILYLWLFPLFSILVKKVVPLQTPAKKKKDSSSEDSSSEEEEPAQKPQKKRKLDQSEESQPKKVSYVLIVIIIIIQGIYQRVKSEKIVFSWYYTSQKMPKLLFFSLKRLFHYSRTRIFTNFLRI